MVKKEEKNQEEVQYTIQERIEAGKVALLDHRIQLAFNLLFEPALTEQRATRLLLKITNEYTRMRLITEAMIKDNGVEEKAKEGSVLAQYVMGRYHQQVKPDEDSPEKANSWFEKAMDAGFGDAFAGKAILVLGGYCGFVDLGRYHSLLEEGFKKGNSVAQCSYPFSMILRDMVFGRKDVSPDPQRAIDEIKALLDGNESDDIDVVDPLYYKILGDAYNQLDDKENAGEYYLKAVDMGYYECIFDYSCLVLPTEDFTHKAWVQWKKMNKVGCERNDPMSLVLSTLYDEVEYDDLPPEKQKKRNEEIRKHLDMADTLGEEFASFIAGYNYYKGCYGFEQDDNMAWEWFWRAAYYEDSTSYAMLAKMIEEGRSPEGFDQTYADEFHLQALRRGEKDELERVVNIYRAGRLTNFAREIESIYIPRFELQQKNTPEEDPYEDLDLNLIAIVRTDGTADIIEFDVEYWDELPDLIGAERLDAIRVQPLYDIGKELSMTDHITGWVDNMGLLKDLMKNPVGCRIYPGPIAGDMILTLEDANYKPKSFTDVYELKKVVAALGASLNGIYLDDGPDDDGRYDPWA